MNTSLTEAQSYTVEARRAEELANRLESQASFFEDHSTAGSLNLSQAYRDWGLAEIESNRDFYGSARFDDATFQLGAKGQALQVRFIESYAAELREGMKDRLILEKGQRAPHSGAAMPGAIPERSGAVTQRRGSAAAEPGAGLKSEVDQARSEGRRKLDAARRDLERVTDPARGASGEAADAVKEW
jgi:conjugal transfer mating pair stabilization protein TraG